MDGRKRTLIAESNQTIADLANGVTQKRRISRRLDGIKKLLQRTSPILRCFLNKRGTAYRRWETNGDTRRSLTGVVILP